ncbi:hypothetical protein BCR34DRAFT_82909 [Clohesyomyces aquaticus]|uniref:Uncharacterized protein n=1 Tax=Clohesyomyces aquaticus TaxID=1231657 RepID=A0A1Y1YWQ3_9PLEO|nr:hypothetical protein BCR34DRAFT_82909 [Clohesyomyces aquaticus]
MWKMRDGQTDASCRRTLTRSSERVPLATSISIRFRFDFGCFPPFCVVWRWPESGCWADVIETPWLKNWLADTRQRCESEHSNTTHNTTAERRLKKIPSCPAAFSTDVPIHPSQHPNCSRPDRLRHACTGFAARPLRPGAVSLARGRAQGCSADLQWLAQPRRVARSDEVAQERQGKLRWPPNCVI